MGKAPPQDHHEELMAMLKRRGYIAPAYDLYGGVAGFYDYGPLGQGLKTRFEALWRRHYVVEEGFGEISCPTIAPEPVFRASGHLGHFNDMLVECPDCKEAMRADHFLVEEFDRIASETAEALDGLAKDAEGTSVKALAEVRDAILEQVGSNRAAIEHTADKNTVTRMLCLPGAEKLSPVELTVGELRLTYLASSVRVTDAAGKVLYANTVNCRSCNSTLHERAHVEPFSLMFATKIGPGSSKAGYLRPETAQGMFVNFSWLYRYHRERVPFGAVQIGRAYRNEIAPRQALLRLREFWQAEAEVFVDPDDKSHPRFAEVAGERVHLVPNTGDELDTTFGKAVGEGLIANEMVAYFLAKTQRILLGAGLRREHVRFRQHEHDEMAHYASDCWDAEYFSPRFGWVEAVGIADRGCYDLENHEKHSGQRLQAFRRFDEPVERDVVRVVPDMKKLGPLFKGEAKEVAEAMEAMDGAKVEAGASLAVTVGGETVEVPGDAFEVQEVRERQEGEWFTPHVVEPSYGIDRILYAALEHSYDPSGEWVVLRLPPWMAPVQAAIFPLVSKDGLPDRADEVALALRRRGLVVTEDASGSIGRRYARQDEVGTPFCITIDHDSLEDDAVTLRERDSQEQKRVPIAELPELLEALVAGTRSFGKL